METIHRVELWGEQHLSGELLDFDEKALQLRTAWSERLSIPRPALVAVTSSLHLMTNHESLTHPVGDYRQDELWLLSGDQLFGEVIRADRRTIEFRMSSRKIGWSEWRRLPAPRNSPPRTTDGEHVRLWLHSGCGAEPDQLEGVLSVLDDHRATLQHAVLGKLDLGARKGSPTSPVVSRPLHRVGQRFSSPWRQGKGHPHAAPTSTSRGASLAAKVSAGRNPR